MERKTEDALARWPYGRPTRADSHMQAISLEVIIAVVFGVTDPDRVERLRAATLALIREGQLAAVLRADDDRHRPRQRLGRPVPADPPRDGRGRRDRARRGRRATPHAVTSTRTTCSGCSCAPTTTHGAPMPDNELCDAMRTLLLGGHETTASTLAWILERVTRHPDVLARLEAAALDGDDDYIDAVIKEAMRLRPVFPITCAPRRRGLRASGD